MLNKISLSPREMEVLVRMAQGKINRVIGAELFVEEKTVKFHMARIYKKCGVTDQGKGKPGRKRLAQMFLKNKERFEVIGPRRAG